MGLWLGMGMEPLFMGGQQTIATSSTEGTFFIDLIDAKKKN
jgi:hypothetical protein